MSLKEQKHSNEKTSSKQRSPKPATESLDIIPQQQIHSASIIQRARLNPRLLISSEVLQLQRIIGNQVVGRLLAQTAQHQPIQKKENKTGLSDNLKPGIEKLSGYSLDDVKVNRDSDKPAQPKLLQEARSKSTAAQNLKLSSSATSYLAPVIQREIWIGQTSYKPYNEQFIGDIYDLAKPYIKQWSRMDEIFRKTTNVATKTAKDHYLDQDREGVNGLRNDVRAMLRKYNHKKPFDNNQDLARQVVQDVKLKLLGMENVIGVDHQDGQFSETADDPTVGRTGKTKTLHIYRTMSADYWKNYTQSNDLGDILYGHGGSLGQAMHYFAMSKRDKKDDVLVEFKFSNTAQNLMDYTQISRGGEGGAPKSNKLTGKSEQNDIMDLDKFIFSVNLHKSKDLIKQLNPQVKLIDSAM